MAMMHSKAIRSWCMYDWAISGFQTTIVAAVLPIFFRQIACAGLPGSQHTTAVILWGYAAAISMLGVALVSLLLGPAADAGSKQKKQLIRFTWIGAILTASLALTGFGDWAWVAVIFILAQTIAAGGEVFYDSLLPHVAPMQMDRVSARGYAFGYIGGGLLLLLNIGMIFFLPRTTGPAGDLQPLWGMRLSFVSVGIWWVLFSLPLARHVPAPALKASYSPQNDVRLSLQRLAHTFREIRQYRRIFVFLLAFWFYNDGIGTVIKMAAIYGNEIGIGMLDLIGALVLAQFLGIPFALLFGKLAEKIGAKSSILIGLLIYTGISVGGYFMTRAIHFWLLAGMVATVQGGTQALSRSVYARLIPREKAAEFFSFYNISGKFAGIVGPALFALTSQLFGNSRLGILSLVFFFILGGVLLLKVEDIET